jgi:hypothetical protein
MTLRELREIIKKAMQENMAFKVKGKSGKETVMSFPNTTAASDLKSKNSNIASVEPLEEKNK